MRAATSKRFSFLRVAWRHVTSERESSAGAALALLLALLPAGLVLVNGSAARVDLRGVIAATGPITVQHAGIADGQPFDEFQRQAQGTVARQLGRYVDRGSAVAIAAPFRLTSIGPHEPTAADARGDVAVTYVDDLPRRVDVVQGLLPRPGAGGGERMASMPLPVADRAGIQLFDIVCITPPPEAGRAGAQATEPWCARVVGLWRMTPAADPRWAARDAPVQLFTDREDFFSLAQLPVTPNFGASRVYKPQASAIAPQDAAPVASRVRQLKAAIGAAGTGEVRTPLDAALDRYAGTSMISFPVELLAAALVPLLVLLAVVTAGWYVEPRLHDLALLRARGWSRGRVQRLVLTQLVMLSLPALAVAVVGGLALAWEAEGGSLSAPALRLSAGEQLAVAVATAVLLVAAVRFVGLARWASRQRVLQLDQQDPRPSRLPSWRGADATGLLVVPAALLLMLPRLAGADRWRLPGVPDDLGALTLSIAGLVMLVMAALPAMSLASGSLRRGRDRLEETLAAWQLRRWWQRHAAAGFLVVFAFATAAFSAVALASQVLAGPASALGQGITASLAIGFASSTMTALLAYGLVFLVNCRSRVDYYAALLVDGLPAAAVRRSIEIEQNSVLLLGLGVGIAIGLILVVATASAGGQSGVALGAVAAGLTATAAIGLAAGCTIAWLVRRHVVGFRLVEHGWRAT